jgi:hypothetical protein
MNRILRHTREYLGNRYHLVRDCVQNQIPFVIYNFTNPTQYNTVLKDIDSYGKLNYSLQVLHSINQSGQRIRRVYPSIFLTNHETSIDNESFKRMVKGSMDTYSLDSIVCLYDGEIAVFYKNGDHHSLGRTIYSSSQFAEFQSDFYQIEGIYYTFIS